MSKDKKNKKREKKSLSVNLSKLTDTLNGELFSDTDLGVNDEEDSAFWVEVPTPHTPQIGDQFEVIGSRANGDILLAPVEQDLGPFKPGDTVFHTEYGEATVVAEDKADIVLDRPPTKDEVIIVEHEGYTIHIVGLTDLTLSIDLEELE